MLALSYRNVDTILMLFYFLLSRVALQDVSSDEDEFSDHESNDAGNRDDANDDSDARSSVGNLEPIVTQQLHEPQEEATVCPPVNLH